MLEVNTTKNNCKWLGAIELNTLNFKNAVIILLEQWIHSINLVEQFQFCYSSYVEGCCTNESNLAEEYIPQMIPSTKKM